jgi:hypothetical protein
LTNASCPEIAGGVLRAAREAALRIDVTWALFNYERVSINTFLWSGADMRALVPVGGNAFVDEEQWITVEAPRVLSERLAQRRVNHLVLDAFSVHHAFGPQRLDLENDRPDILVAYAALGRCARAESFTTSNAEDQVRKRAF